MIYVTRRIAVLMVAVLCFGVPLLEQTAEAKAGGGRSFGSRGSKSFSRPPMSQPGGFRQPLQQRPTVLPTPAPSMPQSGGFLRSLAGGMIGGMLGGMLFSSLAGAGHGGFMGGGGIGLLDIILLAGIGYLIYRMVRKNRSDDRPASGPTYQEVYQDVPVTPADELETGLGHIRQADPGFSADQFKELALDLFFKVQGGWMHRDMTVLSPLMTNEMGRQFQQDIDGLKAQGRINRLENIAIRNVELVEAWQELGTDYITCQIKASLLDYTVDDKTQAVIEGSETAPTTFEEFWTLARPVGSRDWKLSAITQP